jgi:hypothetical protein
MLNEKDETGIDCSRADADVVSLRRLVGRCCAAAATATTAAAADYDSGSVSVSESIQLRCYPC